MKYLSLPVRILTALLAADTAFAAPENLLRNGSFEGGTLYWHQVKEPNQTLVRDAAVGEYALRIAKGNVMSAPFVAERGQRFTVSFFVKGEKPGRVGVQMPPSAREVGTKSKRLWAREGEQSADITTEWKRVSFTWPADVPPDGFWPNPHYLVQIGGYGQPILIDGVTVTKGAEGTPAYVPRREIEVVAECKNLPGYAGAAGNMFEKGATAQMTAHVSNPGKEAREVTVRWQLVDYEGEATLGAPIEKRITLAPGKTFSDTTPLALTHTGMVYARLTALDATGAVLDKSDFPLTSLPYPKAATKPDFRERFGGSFAGGKQMIQKFQRIGFGWTRWYPETKWHNFQKKAGEPFFWYDEQFAIAHSHGVSQHVVLYGWPPGLMDKEHSGQPLPLDMKWPADDPRWDDLSIETAWDKFVKAAVLNYRGKSVIFEIENEPEFDKWEKHYGEYAKFNIRTARLIKQTDPAAKVMVNNVYGIPSAVNAALFRAKDGLKYVDVVSWHDYHAGWLTDANGIKRMRQNLDEAGGKHVEIWFNEGWAFTNTAVDEPIACTHLTAAQSTNAHACSVAEMTVAGQEKTILFHTGYEQHGMSFWDYSGPGTCLWDWYNNPLPLVGMWNVLNHHIGISDESGFVRPPGANLCIFQDLRNGRGVIIAYADRESKADASVSLEAVFGPALKAEDIMGNVGSAPKTLTLSKTGRPVLLYDGSTSGAEFFRRLEKLDRKYASFVSAGGAVPTWSLPPTWEGTTKGASEGSVATADGRPVWKLEQLFPADMKKRENFRPMTWTGTEWNVQEGGFGGQPAIQLKDGVLNLATRAPHGPENARFLRTAGLTFVAPKSGNYALHGRVEHRSWDSKNKVSVHILKKTADSVVKLGSVSVPHGGESSLEGQRVELAAGEELTLLPQIDGMFAGGNARLKDFSITLGEGSATPGYRLPAAWEGTKKGEATGNPIAAAGQPVWRLDRLFPEDPIMAANYSPMIWQGTKWAAPDRTHAGHPSVEIENGNVRMAAMGPWNGDDLNFAKVPALVFIAPESGVYKVTGTASAKPWEGGQKTFPLSFRKKDTQRAAEISSILLPRDGTAIPFSMEVELTAGHELLILPLMRGLYNNAANFTIEGLNVSLAR